MMMRLRTVLAGSALLVTTAHGLSAANDSDDEDAIVMPAFTVSAQRLEDFGMQVAAGRVDPARSSLLWPVRIPVVTAVFPHTAAERAGIKPGDQILRADGKSTASTLFSPRKWNRLQAAKTDAVASAAKNVTWSLEVQSRGTGPPRTVKLTVPTPAPRWGGLEWIPPEGREGSRVAELGPLQERAQLVLINGIAALFSSGASGITNDLGLTKNDSELVSGYQWILFDAAGGRHRLFVTQQRGHTDVVLEASKPGFTRISYLTSPSGALEKWALRGRGASPDSGQVRAGFQAEIGFWLKDAAKLSPRWPLELAIDGGGISNPHPAAPGGSVRSGVPASDIGPRAPQFLSLPRATIFQEELFHDALAKVGADEDHWAYTETSHGLDDKHVTIVRFDPSKAEGERSTLLKIDGRSPTAAQLKTWRDQARDTPATLGDLPPLATVVDLSDLRVNSTDFTSVVFELPIRGGNADFPADKFQALFRVNISLRAFEEINVKMREAITVASVVRITDAGLQARFQTFDSAYPPQPVWLRAGGSARLLFVKISRSFETTRTDFVRVPAYEESQASDAP